VKLRPTIPPHDDFDALVVRTDYSDERAWQEVTATLARRWGDIGFESCLCLVDDRGWAGASVDEVLAGLPTRSGVVFLADRVTMHADHHALLAITTVTRRIRMR
jgi:hypothetical protein